MVDWVAEWTHATDLRQNADASRVGLDVVDLLAGCSSTGSATASPASSLWVDSFMNWLDAGRPPVRRELGECIWLDG